MEMLARSSKESGVENPITVDSLPCTYIAELQQQGFKEKIFNPNTDTSATEKLLDLRQNWCANQQVTVFTSGVYDLLHLNHAGYLLHTKATGAAILYDQLKEEQPWDTISNERQQAFTSWALGSKLLRLIVSVDGDQSVAERKGNKLEKSNTTRPVYSWETRALMVASQVFISPLDKDIYLPTVDAVTIHGPKDFPADSDHATHLQLAEKLQPDVMAIYDESQDTLEEAPHRPGLGSAALRCIMGGKGNYYFEDNFMGNISTTKIANRIIGKA